MKLLRPRCRSPMVHAASRRPVRLGLPVSDQSYVQGPAIGPFHTPAPGHQRLKKSHVS